MKSLHSLTVFALLVAMGGPVRAASPSAERTIESLMARMFAAANAHDTDAFMTSYQRSPDLVFAINGEVIHGWDALHEQQLKWWNNGKSDARYTQVGSPVFMALGSEVEMVTWPLAAHRTQPDGKTVDYAFVVTYLWRRLPQGWRIVHGHESFAKPSG